jgi:hypothetical protein
MRNQRAVTLAIIILATTISISVNTCNASSQETVSVSIQSSGFIQNPTPTATPMPTNTPTPTPTSTPSPTPTPSPTYSYTMRVSGSNYQILNSANTIIKSSTSSSTAFNYLLGPSGIATSGNTIYIQSGNYIVDSTWNINKNSITVTFASGLDATYGAGTPGATLTANPGLNNNIIWIAGNNNIISGATINGNGVNQSPSPTTYLTSTNNNNNNGIIIAGSNTIVQSSTIYNVRCWGAVTFGSATNSGFTNCLIYHIGANGYTDYATSGNNCFFTNNEVWGCSDVGIDSWGGKNTIITGNYAHDENKASCTMYGYANSYEGIDIELGSGSGNGNYLSIVDNNVTNCADCGIFVCTADGSAINNVLISENTITNCGRYGIGIYDSTSSSGSVIKFNSITSCYVGVRVGSQCSGTYVYGNTYSSCQTNYSNSGSGTVTNPP